jgi:hypothetical protein
MTGAALNPARVIGPLAVFHCGKDVAWLYILAQIMAATCACCIFAFVSGLGPLNPLISMGKLGLSWPESINMWLTGGCGCVRGPGLGGCECATAGWV